MGFGFSHLCRKTFDLKNKYVYIIHNKCVDDDLR